MITSARTRTRPASAPVRRRPLSAPAHGYRTASIPDSKISEDAHSLLEVKKVEDVERYLSEKEQDFVAAIAKNPDPLRRELEMVDLISDKLKEAANEQLERGNFVTAHKLKTQITAVKNDLLNQFRDKQKQVQQSEHKNLQLAQSEMLHQFQSQWHQRFEEVEKEAQQKRDELREKHHNQSIVLEQKLSQLSIKDFKCSKQIVDLRRQEAACVRAGELNQARKYHLQAKQLETLEREQYSRQIEERKEQARIQLVARQNDENKKLEQRISDNLLRTKHAKSIELQKLKKSFSIHHTCLNHAHTLDVQRAQHVPQTCNPVLAPPRLHHDTSASKLGTLLLKKQHDSHYSRDRIVPKIAALHDFESNSDFDRQMARFEQVAATLAPRKNGWMQS